MTITRAEVADLQRGDVVEIHRAYWPTGTLLRGPLEVNGPTGDLCIADVIIKANAPGPDKRIAWMVDEGSTLTVVSRAPRPLYVNSDRTEPVPGDVVRDADSADPIKVWIANPDPDGTHYWATSDANWDSASDLPARIRLLVDGESGQVVP